MSDDTLIRQAIEDAKMAVAGLPFRPAPLYDDLYVAIEAALRRIVSGVRAEIAAAEAPAGQPSADAATQPDQAAAPVPPAGASA